MPLTRIVMVATVAALAVASCSDGSNGSSDAAAAGDSTGEPTVATTIPVGGTGGSGIPGSGDGGDGGATGELTAVPDIDLVAAQVDRKIVYRGELSSEVGDVATATRSARDAVAAEGGFVFAEEVSEGTARVVLKVPSIRFDAAFDAVAGIGEVTSQHIEADDVSEQFVDLESRLATLETSIDRLRAFLGQAANVDEISRLESELTRREAEHDVIAGQLRVLRDRTALATITATYSAVEQGAAAAEEEDGGPPGFSRGLEVGWGALVVVGAVVATSVGFVLPFLPVAAMLLLAGWFSRAVRPGRP